MMPSQRACDAENQARNKLSNGPRRVQSNAIYRRVFCNVRAYVSCREYVSIPQSVRRFAANQGGTTDFYSSLTEDSSVKGVFVFGGIYNDIINQAMAKMKSV